jgi:hypothetical protein
MHDEWEIAIEKVGGLIGRVGGFTGHAYEKVGGLSG